MATNQSSSITHAPESVATHPSVQQGIHNYVDYFDIMVIGKTGMGKTTTADKLLMANPAGKEYLGMPHEEPQQDEVNGRVHYNDLFLWHLSNKPGEVEKVSQRLKNLVFCRSLENPHEEINNIHMDSCYESTEQCELLSNDSSKIRVLDVPGFYGSDVAHSTNICDRVRETAENDLSTMRKILHIKMAKKFKFNRIVYFFPEHGVPSRVTQILQTEIGIMENYFGRSIFESMVVIATQPASNYKLFRKDINLFPSKDLEKTKFFFQEAMKKVFTVDKGFKPDDIPDPPIQFISMFDTCEQILEKIKSSKVSKEGVELQFNPSTCARCNIKIGTLRADIPATEDMLATCTYGDWSSAVPYSESTCHPMMIPKYSTLQKVVGGIAHLITFKIFWGKWPSFESLDEVCIKCKEGPKARGCHKVHTVYSKDSVGEIEVDHTSKVNESYIISIESEDDQHGNEGEVQGDEKMAIVGPEYFAPDASLVRGYSLPGSELRGEGDGGVNDQSQGNVENN